MAVPIRVADEYFEKVAEYIAQRLEESVLSTDSSYNTSNRPEHTLRYVFEGNTAFMFDMKNFSSAIVTLNNNGTNATQEFIIEASNDRVLWQSYNGYIVSNKNTQNSEAIFPSLLKTRFLIPNTGPISIAIEKTLRYVRIRGFNVSQFHSCIVQLSNAPLPAKKQPIDSQEYLWKFNSTDPITTGSFQLKSESLISPSFTHALLKLVVKNTGSSGARFGVYAGSQSTPAGTLLYAGYIAAGEFQQLDFTDTPLITPRNTPGIYLVLIDTSNVSLYAFAQGTYFVA